MSDDTQAPTIPTSGWYRPNGINLVWMQYCDLCGALIRHVHACGRTRLLTVYPSSLDDAR